jgi:hypothetical protein
MNVINIVRGMTILYTVLISFVGGSWAAKNAPWSVTFIEQKVVPDIAIGTVAGVLSIALYEMLRNSRKGSRKRK